MTGAGTTGWKDVISHSVARVGVFECKVFTMPGSRDQEVWCWEVRIHGRHGNVRVPALLEGGCKTPELAKGCAVALARAIEPAILEYMPDWLAEEDTPDPPGLRREGSFLIPDGVEVRDPMEILSGDADPVIMPNGPRETDEEPS